MRFPSVSHSLSSRRALGRSLTVPGLGDRVARDFVVDFGRTTLPRAIGPLCQQWSTPFGAAASALLVTDIDAPGLSLDAIRHQIASGGVEFDIEQAAGTDDFLPLARLTLRNLDPSCDDIAFDPTMHSDPEVELAPRWLSDFRRAAYRRSREGRDGQ